MRWSLALCLALSVHAADWSLFRSDGLEVYSNASDKDARRVLLLFDQTRHWTAKTLGKPEIKPLWPVRIVVLDAKSDPRHRTPRIELRRDAYMGGMLASEPVSAQWIRDFVRILLNDDTQVMPRGIEDGLAEVLTTLEVKSTMLTAGAPPTDPARRTRDWARIHLLTLNPEYAGRARAFLFNLQQDAPLDVAYKNAYEKREKEMEALVDAYFKAGKFEPATFSGKPVSPERDYRPRPLQQERVQIALADLVGDRAGYREIVTADGLEGAGKFAESTGSGSESARSWLAYSRMLTDPEKAKEALRRAMELNPRWAEPHFRFSERMVTPGGKVAPLKKAVQLEPRNVAYWQALANAQVEAKDFNGALVTWRGAERAGASPEERARLEELRRAYEQKRIDLLAEEAKRAKEEEERSLAKLKAENDARIREAELRANQKLGPLQSAEKPVEWWDGAKGKANVQGLLDKVDCVQKAAVLTVRDAAGKSARYLIADPAQVAITGPDGQATFACGPQRPPRKVKVEFNPRADAKFASIGDAVGVEFSDAR